MIACNFLPYCDRLAPRQSQQIDLVVIHCTELPTLELAREYGQREVYSSATGNSGHYYIDRDGRTEQYVSIDRVAHHTRGYNERSVGIELVNLGRYPDWYGSQQQTMTQSYTQSQILALTGLLAQLEDELPDLRWIAGHQDLDNESIQASDDPTVSVRRKLDPGPLFPWATILAQSQLERWRP